MCVSAGSDCGTAIIDRDSLCALPSDIGKRVSSCRGALGDAGACARLSQNPPFPPSPRRNDFIARPLLMALVVTAEVAPPLTSNWTRAPGMRTAVLPTTAAVLLQWSEGALPSFLVDKRPLGELFLLSCLRRRRRRLSFRAAVGVSDGTGTGHLGRRLTIAVIGMTNDRVRCTASLTPVIQAFIFCWRIVGLESMPRT